MKKHLSTIILAFAFLTGLSLLLYPTVSNYWNSFHQSRAVVTYAQTVSNLDDELYEQIWDNAIEYNKKLAQTGVKWELSQTEEAEYEKQLVIDDTGMMGYLEISKINCTLPIYHGTDENVLQVAIGHLLGTSLPIGGESTHCVLSGHRGLPSAKLLTDLDQMVVGDTFIIRTLDEVLTYEVDQILIVLPDELDALQIEEGKDLCTLVTCTPYGINTHRLLVRGHRVENEKSIRVTADALQIEPTMVAPILAVPILGILIIWVFVSTRGKKKK